MNISELIKNPEIINTIVKSLVKDNKMNEALYLIKYVTNVDVLIMFVTKFKIPLPEKEDMLSKYPDSAYMYAYYGLGKKRFLKGEPAILRDPKYSYLYASYIIEERWKAAEPIIATHPMYALYYAERFRFRFKEGENAIIRDNDILKKYLNHLKEIDEEKNFFKDHPFLNTILKYDQDKINHIFEQALNTRDTELLEKLLPYISEPYLALKYVSEIAKKRVPEVEHLIARDINFIFKYIEITHEPFELAHSLIATNPEYSYKYALTLGKPFPEGEDAIATNAEYSYLYARDVLKGRFKKGEKVISTHPEFAFYYIRDIIKDRVKIWEPILRKDIEIWKQYLQFLKDVGRYTEWWSEEEERIKKQKEIEYKQKLREKQEEYYKAEEEKLEEEEKEKKKKEKEKEDKSGWDTEIQESLF
jgi:hypothetical protein